MLTRIVFTALLLFSGMPLLCAAQPVKVWEEPLTVPTYEWGPPDPNPFLYDGRTYQGAKGAVYPYPIIDKLTDRRAPRTYKGVYLENEYVKICVLPEFGGRIFSAVDKTNNYDFFYRQNVIKPALMACSGPGSPAAWNGNSPPPPAQQLPTS